MRNFPDLGTARSVAEELDVYRRSVAMARRESGSNPGNLLDMQEWHDWRHELVVRRVRFLSRRH